MRETNAKRRSSSSGYSLGALAFGAVLFAACGGGGREAAGDDAAGLDDAGVPRDAGPTDVFVTDAGADAGNLDAGVDGGDQSLASAPRFKDWTCPDGWIAKPAFNDENGVENPPAGVPQFSVCAPPDDWAPVAMADWPCPTGWAPKPGFADKDGVENPPRGMSQFLACEPPPLPECPDGEVAYLGETSCHAVGTPCPQDGDFLDAASIRALAPGFQGDIVHAKAGATGGNGAPGSPFGSIAEAVGASADNGIIALAKGTFEEFVRVNRPLAFVGSCPGGTTVHAAQPDAYLGVFNVTAPGQSRITNLRVSGARKGVYVLGSNQKQVTIAKVEVKAASETGLILEGAGASVVLSEVVVRDTQGKPGDKTRGEGMEVWDAAMVDGDKVVLERNRSTGILTYSDTRTNFTNLVVKGTLSQESDRSFGLGIDVSDGAVFAADRALLEGNRMAGLFAYAEAGQHPAEVSLQNAVIRDTLSEEDSGSNGRGLAVYDNASLVVSRSLIERNIEVALDISSTSPNGPQVSVEDVIIRDTMCSVGRGTPGFGLSIKGGARCSLARTVVERSRDSGVMVTGIPGTQAAPDVTLSDVVVRDTLDRDMDGAAGGGLFVQHKAKCSVERGLFERNQGLGVFAGAEPGELGPTIDLSDVIVRDSRSAGQDTSSGKGMSIQDGVTADVRRAVIEGNRGAGVRASSSDDGAVPRLTLADVVIRDTESYEGNKENGIGLEITDGSICAANRLVIAGNTLAGAVGYANENRAAATLNLTDVVVAETRGRGSDTNMGWGISLMEGGTAAVSRAIIERNREAGVGLGIMTVDPTLAPPELNISDSVIRHTRSRDSDKRVGYGLEVINGGRCQVDRVLIDGNRTIGVLVGAIPGQLEPDVALADVTISHTKQAECAEIPEGQPLSCVRSGRESGGGSALTVLNKEVRLDRFDIHDNMLCGIQVSRDGLVKAANGDISGNAIGVNIQVEGYDYSTILSPTVRVHDNETNVDTRDLPVPDLSGTGEMSAARVR
jgi:hypothetical protein